MKTALRIFVRDIRRIVINPVAVIIAFGVCLIPSLYAWINILANWDPYNNTSTVPVAVSINDTGSDIPGIGYTNAGDLIRDQLEENTQLGWTFVDEDAAKQGVEAGTYYAAFVIPSDFTASLADVLHGDTDQAHIAYYVNEKVNAISPKVTDTGATTLEQQIAENFVKVVGSTVSEKLQAGVTEAVGKVDDANASVVGELRESQASLAGLSGDLSSAQNTISGTRDAISSARGTLSQLSGTTDSLSHTLNDAMGTLGDTRKRAQTLTTKLSQALGTGVSTISGISSTANYDIGQITGDIGWAQGKVDAAIAQIEALDGTTQSLTSTLETSKKTIASIKLPDGTQMEQQHKIETELQQEIDVTLQLTKAQKDQLARLKQISDDIKAGNDSVRNLSGTVNDAIQKSSQGLVDLQSQLAGTTMPQLSDSLDSFSNAGGKLVGTVGALGPMLREADSSLAQLDNILAQGAGTLTQTAGLLDKAAGNVGSLADDVAGIQSMQSLDAVQKVLGLDPDETGTLLGTPVKMEGNRIFPMENYGSGMTPFYTNLALWVGGFVLVAIFKLEVDTEGIGAFKPWQGFLGRWLLMVLLGLIQALICCLGDLVLGIQCVSPAAFVGAGMVCSFVYVSFIYAISVAFKHIGKALGVLLVILQIPGASGTYPIELQPDFFQALHPWLPFTYGINAMREAIAGFYGNYYAQNIAVLLVYLIPAALIGIAARRHLLNINALFDRRLAETDMMYTERVGMKGSYFRLSTIVKVLMDSGSYRKVFLQRAAQFELMYPTLVRRGFQALVFVPLLLVALLFILPAKYLMLTLWIISMVGICTFLIVVEYFHSRVGQKTALASMDKEQLYGLLDDELRSELMAFAPIQKMRLDRKAREEGAVPGDGDAGVTQVVPGRKDAPAGKAPASANSPARANSKGPDQTQVAPAQPTERLPRHDDQKGGER